MCNFFSFLASKNGKLYFDPEQRKTELDPDSHSRIAEFFLKSSLQEDRWNKYEFTSKGLIADSIVDPEVEFDDVKDWAKKFSQTREFWAICVRALSRGTACLELVRKDKRKTTEEMIHEYACWSAEQSLANYEKFAPGDTRVRDAIAAKRKWLKGEITNDKLAIAESAAWSAARSVAWSAAWSVAWSAAESAAESARSAARSVAWSAAESARSAAESAAWSAAESAAVAFVAESAAWSAAEKAQQKKLDELMEIAWGKNNV